MRREIYENRKESLSSQDWDQYSISSECKRFEDFDLKNVRNLKNYDCWDDDLTPDE